MTIDQLRKAVRQQPFRPFNNCLGDGHEISVPHPECVMIGVEAARTFGVAGKNEDYRIIDLLLVPSLDFTNGHVEQESGPL